MKKFVSLVLVLALALSLCTVAMAAETKGSSKSESIDKDDLKIAVMDSNEEFWDTAEKATADGTKYTHEDNVSAKGVHTVFADVYYVKTDSGEGYYAEVAEAVADAKLTVAGKTVYAYKLSSFVPATDGTWLSTDKVVSEKVAKDSDMNCGAYLNSSDKPIAVYIIDGDAYAKDSTGNGVALYKGEFVFYDDSAAVTNTVQHVFKAANTTFKAVDNKGHNVPVSVKCSECGKTFSVVEKGDRDANKTAAFYQELKSSVDGMANLPIGDSTTDYYFAVVGTTAAAGSTSTTVDSSKTFDAGVAMYVGLSLMSVAGSAVVIGKKKEF